MPLAFPKPLQRGPKPRKRIARTARVRQRSPRRSSVEKADADWAAKVKAAGVCELAGMQHRCSRTLDAHHVYGKKSRPRLRHDIDNGIALCRTGHRLAHRKPAFFLMWFAMRDPVRAYRLTQKAQREARIA